MFSFFNMANDYDDRKVARGEYPWGFVSTAKVNDGARDYETAVEHKRYNHGKMVIVQSYETRGEAEEGHRAWVEKMTTGELPAYLDDCANSTIAQLIGEERFYLDGITQR